MSEFTHTDAQRLCEGIRAAAMLRTDDDGQALYALSNTLLVVLSVERREHEGTYRQGMNEGLIVARDMATKFLGRHTTAGRLA